MVHDVSPERKVLNEIMLERFRGYLKEGDVLYDIGKSRTWDYRSFFEKQKFFTVDRNKEISPDLCFNVESIYKVEGRLCDAIICNGVVEQCDNPFELLRGLKVLLKKDSYVLFGVILVGYPLYQEFDFFRFTPMGVKKVMKDFNFEILEEQMCYRNDVPSYIYLICQSK
jgi:hypothetical protein